MPAYTRDIESSGQTDFPRDVAEMALAHTIAERVEAAYRRGDLFEKRRLMEARKSYCAINITDPKVSDVDQSSQHTGLLLRRTETGSDVSTKVSQPA